MEPIARGRRIRRVAAWIFGLAVLLFGLVYVGISAFTADRLTQPTNRPLPIDPRRVSEDAREWLTRTNDGLTLRGWYLPTEKKRHLLVLVHGMWSSWLEMAGLGRDLHERGFDVLLFDLRGHGQSDPSRLYLGRRERADIRAVMSWALAAGFPNDRIGWLGYSMGGSTLLMEAARNPQIQVAVIDSPYGDLPKLLDTPAQQAQRTASLVQPGYPAGGPMDLRGAHRRPDPDPVRPLVGRTAGPAHPRRVRHDRARRARRASCADPRRLVPDAHAAWRRARASVPERPGGLCPDGRIVLRFPPQPMSPRTRLRGASARTGDRGPSRCAKSARAKRPEEGALRRPESSTVVMPGSTWPARVHPDATASAESPVRSGDRDQGPVPPWVR